MQPLSKHEARRVLVHDYAFTRYRAERVLNIAWEFTAKAEPCEGGYVMVRYRGNVSGKPGEHLFEIEDCRMTESERKAFAANRGLAASAEKRYTHARQTDPARNPRRKGREMPRNASTAAPARRGRTPKPAPAAEANGEGALDVQKYLTKPLTATMRDYVEWFETEVSPLADLRRDPARILVLGIQLYTHFQKSDFNQDQREARRAERASAAPEPAPATRTRSTRGSRSTASTGSRTGTSAGRGRKPAADKPAPATPARRGRPPKAAAAAAPAKPPARRGRPPKASGKDAPF